jgi:hypothetical protein
MSVFRIAMPFLLLVAATFTTGCQTVPRTPGPEAGAYSDISPTELRDILAGLSRSHGQKTQLVFYLTLPWVSVEPVVRPIFTNMGTVQADLDKQLQDWADSHKIDLFFRFTEDIAGQAQKKLEDEQGKIVTGDGRADLTRDALMQMYMDYQWQISVLQTLMPKVRDPQLRIYLQKSLKVHQDGGAEIRKMLQRFKIS